MRMCDALVVIGAGSYGTALAISVASKGYEVCLVAKDQITAATLAAERENTKYLSGIKFPPSLEISCDLYYALSFARDILIVVPSSAFSSILTAISSHLTSRHRILWATKGLEYGTGEFLSNVAQRQLSALGLHLPLAALSGPTFARELACGMPTAIACAGIGYDNFVDDMCKLLHTPSFRVYKSHDILALQIGGAVKNVIAIAAGMSDGLGYGANARTALITRGHAEMIRLGVALGASDRGFMGLSGLGDLVLTCTDDQSRNRRFGYMLGQGMDASTALAQIGQVVEGYHMVKEIYTLASRLKIVMPICHELYQVIVDGKDSHLAARDLLARDLTTE